MDISNVKTVAVVGVGAMGHGIAQLAVMAGYDINICDIKEEFVDKAEANIYASLYKLGLKGKISSIEIERIKAGKIRKFTSIPDAVKDAQLVVEAVPEWEDLKRNTLTAISNAISEDAVIASNTSTMSISDLSAYVKNPGRFVGTHYFNPPVLMQLVEVVMGKDTSEETISFCRDYIAKIGKVIVVAKKDRPGFIANRIYAPTIAFNGLKLDVDKLDPADIDLSMMSIGFKMGPMMLEDYERIDVVNDCQDYYCSHLSPEYAPSEFSRVLVRNGFVGKKAGQGFYKWPETGKPELDPGRMTGKYDPNEMVFIMANEATKLLEEGVCTLKECDLAMQYGYGLTGPVEYIQKFEPAFIAEKLDAIALKYGRGIFAPTQTIRNGLYKY